MKRFTSAAVAFLVPALLSAQTQLATLGQCTLELGGVIEDCRVAYQTFGTLAGDRRNAILVPTWFASRAESWRPLLGPNGVVDTTGFFVIVVESLGAGESSSPSTSGSQRGAAFPAITVGDMVESQYRLTREYLGLPELYAVVGISLGGNEAFEWAVSHPDFVRRVVPIVGTPRLATWDRALWELIAGTVDAGLRGVVTSDSTSRLLARPLILAISSPAAANLQPSGGDEKTLARQAEMPRAANLFEWAAHAHAILRHDVARRFDGDLNAAASRWRGRAFVVTATLDHSHNPQPAQDFARLLRADTLVIATPAGHGAIFSDSSAKAAVRRFLSR